MPTGLERTVTGGQPRTLETGRRRWAVLAVVSAAQFLTILDLWVVNIAGLATGRQLSYVPAAAKADTAADALVTSPAGPGPSGSAARIGEWAE